MIASTLQAPAPAPTRPGAAGRAQRTVASRDRTTAASPGRARRGRRSGDARGYQRVSATPACPRTASVFPGLQQSAVLNRGCNEMKPVNIHSLPDTRCLEALRDACQRVLGPELQTPLAKHYLNLLGMVLNRWHAANSRLPAIESQHASERATPDAARAAAARSTSVASHTPSHDATLPRSFASCSLHCRSAAPEGAASIRTLLGAIVATDAAVRREFESAVADVTKRGDERRRSRASNRRSSRAAGVSAARDFQGRRT